MNSNMTRNIWPLGSAYDMLNVSIANPADDEELALTLNGKKKKLKDPDFEKAFETCGIPAKVFSNLKQKYIRLYPAFCDFIDSSFLDCQMKADYQTLLAERLAIDAHFDVQKLNQYVINWKVHSSGDGFVLRFGQKCDFVQNSAETPCEFQPNGTTHNSDFFCDKFPDLETYLYICSEMKNVGL